MISDCRFITEDGTEIVMDEVISITVNGKTYPVEDISWDEVYEGVRKFVEELHKDPVVNARQQKEVFNQLERQKEELEK